MVTAAIRPMGERALLAEVDDLAAVVLLHAALAAGVPAGVEDLVPAARTVLIRFDPARLPRAAVVAWVRDAASSPVPDVMAAPPVVEVAVRYDGPDLAETAQVLGIPPSELARRHAAADWTVAFTGFAPGFAYLVSADWPFEVPRLARPRTRVPAGSVGLAGEFSGAYPRETPGGWRLIATTTAPLFSPDAAEPVLLPPRARVRFVPERPVVRGVVPEFPVGKGGDAAGGGAATLLPSSAGRISSAERGVALTVLAPGPLTTVQDLGRPGRAALGVARSGALDRRALRVANRLVGNTEDAAGLEVLLGGLRVRALRDTWVAVAGALGDVLVDGRAMDAYRPLLLPAGAELALGAARAGLRFSVAVRGGLRATTALGSASRDVLAGLGPEPLRAGDELIVADGERHAVPAVDVFPWTVPPSEIDVPLARGSREEWFTVAARELLVDARWTVSSDADRVGLRLDGPVLERRVEGELASEGMVPGALQVPPHGRPVVLLADGPVTGGYPVIGVVRDEALDALAQARPGDTVRFRRS
ncbi:5-oxoprolinase/urea amidolyase family protein [Microbacterium enclense]|uniref:5-oxoprolinase subunit B/C family protein n=1 Tax=Microbacterium enclense TaxID=993073 RepID=UPI0036D87745